MSQTGWSQEQVDAFLAMQLEAQSRHFRQAFPAASHRIILVGNKPAGRLIVDQTGRLVRLIDITLLPEYCGRGIGSQLLRSLLANAEQLGKRVQLHVAHGNPARNLYRKLVSSRRKTRVPTYG